MMLAAVMMPEARERRESRGLRPHAAAARTQQQPARSSGPQSSGGKSLLRRAFPCFLAYKHPWPGPRRFAARALTQSTHTQSRTRSRAHRACEARQGAQRGEHDPRGGAARRDYREGVFAMATWGGGHAKVLQGAVCCWQRV